MIKMYKKHGKTVVVKDGKKHCFGEGAEGTKRAWEYVKIQHFIAKVNGVDICSRFDTAYPVRSMVPNGVGKTVRYTVEV